MNFYKRLESLEIIYFKDCYKHCLGHCCNTLRADACIIPMLKSEYEAYKSRLDLKLIARLKFALSSQKNLELCFLECKKRGLCSFRPLACKLYPFYLDSELGCAPISLYDMFYQNLQNHPCYLVSQRFNECEKQFRAALKRFKNEPILIFIFTSIEILRKHLRKHFAKNNADFCLDNVRDKARFFSENDFAKAWQNEDFKSEFRQNYARLLARFKDELDKYL